MSKCLKLSAIVVGWMACTGPAAAESAAAPGAHKGDTLLEQVVEVLATGDQKSYERFAQRNYSPAALSEYSAEDRASSLARIYTDTGGFEIERVVREAPTFVQAEARDKITGVRYCLTLKHTVAGGRARITDFSTKGLYPADSDLRTPTSDEVVRTIQELAEEYTKRNDFSGVILIAKDDTIIFNNAYGHASLAYDAQVTLDTRLNVASIGKMFTGVAIAQLVDAGKLSYDDTVGKQLPDYPDKAVRDRVTVRQLLSHTSGLGPKDYYNGPLWSSGRSRLRSVPDYMKLVVGTPLDGEPGKFLYSNSGYVLLGAIIEKLSGQSYYDYVRDHIFTPAGMTRSFYHETDQEDPDVAVSFTNLFNKGDDAYIYRLGRPRNSILEGPVKGGPQGGAYVTAADLFAFLVALRKGQLISSARQHEMSAAQSPSGAGAGGLVGDVREGLGVEVIRQNGHTFFGHSGGDLGVASILYWYPDTGYTTIILSNRDPRAVRVMTNVSRALITRQTVNGAVPPAQKCVAPTSD